MSWRAWIKERMPYESVLEALRHKVVPQHRHSFWYYFGGMTLFLYGVQVATGILLLLYYRPGADAFESVQFIMTEVRFGWLVRSIHSWGANVMIGVLFVHMFSVFFLKAYRKPRELTWVTGVLLFFIALGFGFSGYLLPWNTLSFFATKVGTEIAGQVPVAGPFVLRFLRGGEDVTAATLSRFFGWHVAVLPALGALLIAVHLLLVQQHGMSTPSGTESRRAMPFLPNFLLRDLAGWLAALAVLASLAALYPWELGEKADPFAPAPAGIRPEWYFLFMFQTLKVLPGHVLFLEGETLGILAFSAGFLWWLLVPFLHGRLDGRRARILNWVGACIVTYIALLTVVAYWSSAG